MSQAGPSGVRLTGQQTPPALPLTVLPGRTSRGLPLPQKPRARAAGLEDLQSGASALVSTLGCS